MLKKEFLINNQYIMLDFNDIEHTQLIDFYSEYLQLSESNIIKNNIIEKCFYISGKNQALNVSKYDKDSISAFLHMLRPFILKNEDCYLNKIKNTLYQKINSESFRNELKNITKIFNNPESHIPIKINIENRQVNTSELLNLYLNSFEYHRDKNKRNQIMSIVSNDEFLEVFKVFLLPLLLKKLNAIKRLGILVGIILNECDLKIIK